MKRQFIIVVDVPSNNESVNAEALMRLGFFMIGDHKTHPEALMQFKDTIDNANNPDD
jgi:hypothetical protein